MFGTMLSKDETRSKFWPRNDLYFPPCQQVRAAMRPAGRWSPAHLVPNSWYGFLLVQIVPDEPRKRSALRYVEEHLNGGSLPYYITPEL